MLVEEVRDFEEQRNAKEAELQTLQKQLIDVEAQLSSRTKRDGVGPPDLAAKVAALEEEKRALEAQLRSGSDAPGSNSNAGKEHSDAVRTLQKRVAELEAEASELTEESAKLAGDLTNAQAEVKQREGRVVELERALKLERAVHEAVQQSPESSIQVARLTNMVKELQGRLTEAELRPGSAGSDLDRRFSLGSDFGGSNEELRSEEVENILGGLTMLKTLARVRSNDSSEVVALRKKVGQLTTQVETNANELSRTNMMVERELAIRRSEVEGAMETIRSLEEELDGANQTVHSFEMKLQDANDAIARFESGEEVSVLRKQVTTLQLDLRSARDGKDTAARTFERLSSGAASETIRNLSEELEAAQKTIQGLEGELESAHLTIQQLEAGGETPRGLGEELNLLKATVATLKADLASAREGRDNVTRQYDRLKQLLEEDSSEERIEELEVRESTPGLWIPRRHL
jgi:chromosome segregation ATPase